LLALAMCCTAVVSNAADRSEIWVGAWGFPAIPVPPAPTPAMPAAPPFNNVTVRQVVRISAAAERLRIRVSNEFSAAPLRLGAVHIAKLQQDGTAVPGSDHTLTFSGDGSIVVVPHSPAVSDAIDWKIPAFTRLLVSAYLPDDVAQPAHRAWEYISPGDSTGAARSPEALFTHAGALFSEVDIVSPDARKTVVMLGDSITEGFGSSINSFHGWVDLVAERLRANRRSRDWSVVNAGINSNRLLHDTPGANALARFDRDVLAAPGTAAVVLLEGINDIGYSHTHPEEAVTAKDIIRAYRQLIARAREHGVAIIGGTLTPFEQSHYFDETGEQTRQEVNAWIRDSREFDAVIDFDAVLRDPQHPGSVRAELERGDHLHPNDAGYAAMAEVVTPEILTGITRRRR
jgi:lysophospholipase L1-like esterase